MNTIKPTNEQQKAIDYSGSMVVIAKPGSGKTYVLSEKIREILPDLPSHQGIIAISYTNKASNELKKRITRNGINKKSSFFGTIDKYCDGEIIIPFLSQMWGNPTNNVTITKVSNLNKEERELFPFIRINQFNLEDLKPHLELIKLYFLNGQLFLETNGALALYVLRNSTACQKYIKARYTHVFIDEYQDSGREQHELLLELKELGLVVVAVGDADQSIFGFSGKDSKYLLELAKSKQYKLFVINKNHRCHPSIISYSLRLLNETATLLETDECRVFYKSVSGKQSSIAAWIDTILDDLCDQYGVGRKCDVGILVRNGISGEYINDVFKTKHRYFINHPLENHLSLWGKLFYQLLLFRFDKTITAEEFIDDAIAVISENDKKKLRGKIKSIRRINQGELLNVLVEVAEVLIPRGRSDEAINQLKDCLSADLSVSFTPASDDEVQIMTLHKAKGLEFDVVFHLDMYEWIFPAKRPGPDRDFQNPIFSSFEQDVNLHYVGITRARKACFLCTSSKRRAIDYSTKQFTTRNGSPSDFFEYHNLFELIELSEM